MYALPPFFYFNNSESLCDAYEYKQELMLFVQGQKATVSVAKTEAPFGTY